LTSQGEKRVKQIGAGLKTLELKLDAIVTSPLPRAHRTAELIAAELGMEPKLEIAPVLTSGSDAASIRDWLRKRTEARLMIVGHNPAFSELVSLLVLGESGGLHIELKKGGIASLSSSPSMGPRFNLSWIAPPRLLRRLAVNRS
jgi:phosphohistidine phosphatase